jgi:hypothetical protein
MTESRFSSLRESARQEMPAPLRAEVRLLGELLGQVLTEFGGPQLLEDVEQLRQTVIAAREADDQEQAAEQLVASWPLERAEQVARAFACYFHLANLAEERHRARILRERARQPQPLRESLAATVAEVRDGQGEERLAELPGERWSQPSGESVSSSTCSTTRAAPLTNRMRRGGGCWRRSTCSGARRNCGARRSSPQTRSEL